MRLDLSVAAAIALGSAAALAGGAGTAESRARGQDVSAVRPLVPPGWSRTAGVSCPADVAQGDPDCFQVDYYRGPLGQWLRVVVDPPGEPQGYDVVLPLRRDDRGRIDPVGTIPADVAGLRSVAVTGSAGGRRYAVLHGAGPDAPLEVEALRAFVWSLDRR
jgi:hypothetical protein